MLLPMLFFLMGLGLSALAVLAFAKALLLVARARKGQGEVLAIEQRWTWQGVQPKYWGISYFPVVGFQTENGERVEFRAHVSSDSPSTYRVGQSVPILYDPNNPSNARIHGFMSLWMGPLLLGFMGFVFTVIGGVWVLTA